MTEYSSFLCVSKFYAQEYFPYGLSRCGEFNITQASLLEEFGRAYQAIHNGEREPANEEERQFLEVCQGLREPETQHEKAWKVFCKKTAMQPSGSALGSINLTEFSSDIDEDSYGNCW